MGIDLKVQCCGAAEMACAKGKLRAARPFGAIAAKRAYTCGAEWMFLGEDLVEKWQNCAAGIGYRCG
jgi:hypothetical protein